MLHGVLLPYVGTDRSDGAIKFGALVHRPYEETDMPYARNPNHFYSPRLLGEATRDRSIARERIAVDTEAFTRNGGHIQVLGVTPLRRKDASTPTLTAVLSGHAAV